MVQTCCEAVKSLKNHKKWLETLELEVPSCQSWKIWKNHTGSVPGQPLPAKTLMGPPRAINLGGNLWILDFWPKTISFHMVMHKKATITLWFAKNPRQNRCFFSFWVILGSFKGRQKAPRAINLGGDLSTLDFCPKNISFHLVLHLSLIHISEPTRPY